MKKVFKRSIYTKKESALAFFMALLLPSLLLINVLLFTFPVFFVNQNALDKAPIFILIISAIISQVAFFIIYLAINKGMKFNIKKASKLSFKLSLRNVLLSLLIGIITLVGLNMLISMIDTLLIKWLNHTPSAFPLPLNTVGWLIVNILALAVLPGICEELVFRGIIYNGLKQYGSKIAIIFSAFLFALIHTNIEQTVYPFLFGIILAFIVLKTNNIIYAMLAHFINNATVLVMNFLNIKGIINFSGEFSLNFLNIFLSILFAVLTFVVVYFIAKLFKKDKSTDTTLSKEEKDIFIQDLFSENKTTVDATTENNEVRENITQEQWEMLITYKNDTNALEETSKKKNVLLWVSIGLGIILWILSI